MTIQRISVHAQIDVEIDGQPAQLSGQGADLLLLLKSEEALVRLVDGGPAAGHVARVLADLGLALTVADERRPLLTIGHGASSRLSRLLTGSRHVVPANLSALFLLLRSYLLARTARRPFPTA